MKYKVHRMEIDMEKDQERLENFLNNLKGEVVSILPNIAKTTLFQIYGAARKIDFILIVERLKCSPPKFRYKSYRPLLYPCPIIGCSGANHH